MHAPISAARIDAAQHAISAIQSRVWTFTHPETMCACRAEYVDGLLTVEVTDGPDCLDPDDWRNLDSYERAVCETLVLLDKAGVLRSAVASAAAAERELRLVADAIREVL